MTKRSIRAQPKEKLLMLNGTTSWICAETRRNMDKIYEWLESKFKGRFLGTGRLTFPFSKIAKETNINPVQVSFACQKLAFLKKPVIRIHARRHTSKIGVKTYEGVELIRRIPLESEEKTEKSGTETECDYPTK